MTDPTLHDNLQTMRFSPRMLLTPHDYAAFQALRQNGFRLVWPFRLLATPFGRRFVLRLAMSRVGWLLGDVILWVGTRLQAARHPLSPFKWIQTLWRAAYKWQRKAGPLSPVQQSQVRAAASALHPDAQTHVLAIKLFQAALPHNWLGQYTAFGDIALRAGLEVIDPDLVRHEWAHYWWGHHMTRRERQAFIETAVSLARVPDLPPEMRFAQEVARAYVEGRDLHVREGDRVLVFPLHSSDGYRVAYCFNLIDLEVHAYIAHLCRGDASRLPPVLRPFYAGFFQT